jgi:phage shock protein A
MEQPKIKSFFERPEGNTGLLFIGAGIVGTGVACWYLLPVIIVILSNLLYASLLGAGVFALFTLLMNDKFRFACSSLFQSAMRWLTGWVIAIDPIGILKNYLEEMKERLAKVEKHIREVNGQKVSLERNITERLKNIEQYMKLANAAKKAGQTDQAALKANMAAREKHFADKLAVILDKTEGILRILSKMKSNLNFLYEDTEHEVEIREAEYNSIKASFKAMKGAEALIEGDKAKAMFEQTMEYTANDIAMKLGEMDRFMDTSKDFMLSMDLQNGVFNEDGLALLAQWEQNGSAILSYKAGDLSGKVRVDSSVPVEDELPPVEVSNNEFSKIFLK